MKLLNFSSCWFHQDFIFWTFDSSNFNWTKPNQTEPNWTFLKLYWTLLNRQEPTRTYMNRTISPKLNTCEPSLKSNEMLIIRANLWNIVLGSPFKTVNLRWTLWEPCEPCQWTLRTFVFFAIFSRFTGKVRKFPRRFT